MDIRREFSAYHGTTWSGGYNILRSGSFFLSAKENEWLGTGAYFWQTLKDARWWASLKCEKPEHEGEEPLILGVDLRCEPERFMDLDDRHQMDLLNREANALKAGLEADGVDGLNFQSDEQLMCFVCNYYKRLYQIDLMAYTFPRTHRNDAGFPFILSQKQYCTTNNDIIFNIRMEAEHYVV